MLPDCGTIKETNSTRLCAWVQVPLMMMEQKAHVTISNILGLTGYNNIDMHRWRHNVADRWDTHPESVNIAIIGKYTDLSDAYLSVIKALQHACLARRRQLKLSWVEAGNIEEEVRLIDDVVDCA